MQREYNPHSTAPKPYRCALADLQPGQRKLFQVIDRSDGDYVVETFRNAALAERLAATMPSYEVREFLIGKP